MIYKDGAEMRVRKDMTSRWTCAVSLSKGRNTGCVNSSCEQVFELKHK